MLIWIEIGCVFITVVLSIIEANVPGEPSVQPFSVPGPVTKGASVTFACAVTTGSGPFSFTWTKDGDPLVDHHLNKVQMSEENSLLTLKSADHSRSGNYTCTVTNEIGMGSYTAELVVFEQPEWLLMPEDVEVILGNKLQIDCMAVGVPEPNVTWRKLEGTKFVLVTTGGRHMTANNGSLILNTTQIGDEGKYECSVSNNIGEGLTKVVSIRVHVPPLFRENFHLLKVRSSHSAVLQCEVTGDTPLSVKWSKEYLAESKEFRYEIQDTPLPNGLLSELYVTRVSRQDAGLYVCMATNNYGQQERTIKLVVLEPPASPADVLVKQIDSDEVTIRWSTPYSGNSPVVQYILQYWKDTGAPPKLEEENVSSDKTTIILRGLRPGTSYIIRVIAENEFGQSTPSVPLKFSTAEENPSGYPTDLSVFPRGAHALLIRWKAPPPDQRNGAIQGYDLGYRNRHTSDHYTYHEVPLNPSIIQEYALDKLKENTEYEIVVRAYNSAGRGPASVPVVARTREKGHLVTPVLWVESSSAKTISLRWSGNGNDVIRIDPLHYSLHYRAEGGMWLEKVIPSSNQNSYLLTGLEEDTQYDVYIQAVSGMDRSAPSATVIVRTSDPNYLRSSMAQVTEVNHQTTLVISLSVVVSTVIIVCVIAGACVYVTRVRSNSDRSKADELGSRHLTEQRSNSGSTRMSQAANFRYVDVNSRPLLWCSTPAPPNDYPSPYATLPLRCTPVSKRWQSDDRLSPAASERSESLVNQRVDTVEDKTSICHD